MINKTDIIDKVMSIPGWTSFEDLSLLIDLVGMLPSDATVVEVGVYMGRSICSMALASKGASIKIFGIDKFSDEAGDDWPEDKKHLTWEEYVPGFESPTVEKVQESLFRLGISNVELWKGHGSQLASKFADNSIDLLFIDASHDYESVKNEIDSFLPKMKRNSIIAGDDYSWPGVSRAVSESFGNGNYRVTPNDKIWYATPPARTRACTNKKLKIGLNLYGIGTLDMSKPGNFQGDEQVALGWKKYLERRDDVDKVQLFAQSQNMADDLDVLIHFNPSLASHPTAKNILYLQNAFPPEQYDGGTSGVFERCRDEFSGYIFTSEKLKSACAPGAVIPFATDPEIFTPTHDERYKHPVSFVGNDIRGPVVNARYLIPAMPFGLALYSKNPWAGDLRQAWLGGLPQEDLASLYSSSLINLNAHITEHIDWGTINLRVYDILACGGFVMSDDMPELLDAFDGAVVCTAGYEDEWAKLARFLEDGESRKRLAAKGRAIVLASHSYAHRMDALINYLKEVL